MANKARRKAMMIMSSPLETPHTPMADIVPGTPVAGPRCRQTIRPRSSSQWGSWLPSILAKRALVTYHPKYQPLLRRMPMPQAHRLRPYSEQAWIIPQKHVTLDDGTLLVPGGEGFGEVWGGHLIPANLTDCVFTISFAQE